MRKKKVLLSNTNLINLGTETKMELTGHAQSGDSSAFGRRSLDLTHSSATEKARLKNIP